MMTFLTEFKKPVIIIICIVVLSCSYEFIHRYKYVLYQYNLFRKHTFFQTKYHIISYATKAKLGHYNICNLVIDRLLKFLMFT